MAPRLDHRVAPRASLDAELRRRMFELMRHCYDNVEEPRFQADLDAKQHVILLTERSTGRLAGFSTIRLTEETLEGRRVEVLFSGDTAIHPDFWGSKLLQRAFGLFVVRRRLRHPFRPIFWLLISKGYRTYLLLVNHFPRSFPRFDHTPSDERAGFLSRLAERWWPDAWDSTRGILKFPERHDFVRTDLAPIDDEVLANPHVRYFVERNPGHAQGNELVCLAELRVGDLLRALVLGLVQRLRRRPAQAAVEGASA